VKGRKYKIPRWTTASKVDSSRRVGYLLRYFTGEGFLAALPSHRTTPPALELFVMHARYFRLQGTM